MKTGLIIGGLDPSGGAGILADLRTFIEYGVHGLVIETSFVPQTTKEVFSVIPISEKEIEEQFRSVGGVTHFCKISLLPTKSIVRCISRLVEGMNIVLDPLLNAGVGKSLTENGVLDEIIRELFPKTLILTPNIFEAEKITGMKITNEKEQKEACKKIYEKGVKNVVVKGGHLNHIDVLYDGKEFTSINSNINFEGQVHGTGCTYSSSLCSELIKGNDLISACKNAKVFTEKSIINAIEFQGGLIANQEGIL